MALLATKSVLVCFALEAEARPFREKLRREHPIRILVTGMGPPNARQSIQRSLADFVPSAVLTCGLAGGLDPALARTTVLMEADEGFPFIPQLQAAGAKPGRFYCSPRVIITAAEKSQTRKAQQADAVDMESAVIRQECQSRQIPSATVRVISDTAAEDLPLDFNQYLDGDYRMNYPKIMAKALASPTRIHQLLLFQRQAKASAKVLADTLWRALTRTAECNSALRGGHSSTHPADSSVS
jgi:hypothetical protein